MIFLTIIIVAAALGGGVVYGFWLTLGALAFLFYLAVAWRWTQMAFYFLVAYLPFQAALNLSSDVDLMSGRILILGLFGVWAVKELISYRKSLICHPELRLCGAKDISRMRDAHSGEILPPPLRGQNDSIYLKNNHILWVLVLFFILSVISIFGAENQIWGLRKLLVFVSIFPLFFLTSALIKDQKELYKLIYIVIGSAAVSAVIALAQFLAQFVFGADSVMIFWVSYIVPIFSGASFGSLVASNPSWLVNIGGQTIMRAIGLFPDPHALAFYLGLTSPFTLALAFFGSKHRSIFFTVYCLLLTVLFLTFSRGGYLGLLFSLAVFVFFAWQRFDSKDKKFFGVTILLAAAILLLVGWPVASRLISSFDIQEGSNMGRLSIWQDSRQIIRKNPIIGVGLGNYSLAVSFNQDYRNAITSHNLYLDIWSEMGILGLLAWLAVFLAAAREAQKRIKDNFILSIGCLSALAYFFTHSFFETAIFNPTVLAMLMVVLGLAVADYEG